MEHTTLPLWKQKQQRRDHLIEQAESDPDFFAKIIRDEKELRGRMRSTRNPAEVSSHLHDLQVLLGITPWQAQDK